MPEQMLVVLDGCGGLGRRGEGDEAETARLAPLAVHDHHCLLCDARLDSAAGRKREQLEAQVAECESVLPGTCLDNAVLREQFFKVLLSGREIEVADINLAIILGSWNGTIAISRGRIEREALGVP